MYEKITKETRAKVAKLTLEQQKHLSDIYEDAIKELAKTARDTNRKELTIRWAKDYKKQLMKVRRGLRADIREQITSSTLKSAKLGSEGQQLIMKEILNLVDIDLKPSFSNMFSQVNDNVVKDIISGNLYKDNKTLSGRIWTHSKEFERDIQYTINQAILEKKSAIELADDLNKYVKEPAKRGSDWDKVYPNLKHRKADYNAIRLARTSISHAYQNSTVQSSTMNPFVDGIEWQSALIHGRTCQLCRDRHGQIYTTDNIPLDHPNGLCTFVPNITKSMEEIGEILGNWVDGGSNLMLDEWYEKYGEEFINM